MHDQLDPNASKNRKSDMKRLLPWRPALCADARIRGLDRPHARQRKECQYCNRSVPLQGGLFQPGELCFRLNIFWRRTCSNEDLVAHLRQTFQDLFAEVADLSTPVPMVDVELLPLPPIRDHPVFE